MLYKDKITHKVELTQKDGIAKLLFSCDGGKHGTDEVLDEIEIPVTELLAVLQINEKQKETIAEFQRDRDLEQADYDKWEKANA